MSVLARFRDEAATEFEMNAVKLHKYTHQRLSSVPNRRKKFVCPKIQKLTSSMYCDVIMGNEQNSRTEEGQSERRALFERAIRTLTRLQDPLIVFTSLQDASEGGMQEWIGMINREIALPVGSAMSGMHIHTEHGRTCYGIIIRYSVDTKRKECMHEVNYYKVYKDGELYCVNNIFLRYQAKHNTLLACDIQEAQYICSPSGEEIWHARWLNKIPDGAPQYPTMESAEIPEDEYRALMSVSDDGNLSDADIEDDPILEETPPDDAEAAEQLDFVRQRKIEQMSQLCNDAIVSGVDVELSDGNTHHFSLTLEDQMNLLSLQSMIFAGADAIPYHADGEECRYYSAEDFTAIATAVTNWKLYQESYFNSLRAYIQSMETMPELLAVEYGMEVPEEYQTVVLRQIMSQMGGS